MFRRNLFKRVLPVVLSVAMLMGDLPVSSLTAYAAEDTATAVEESADAGKVLDEVKHTVDGNDVVPLSEVVVDRDELVNELENRFDFVEDSLKRTYNPSAGDVGYAATVEKAVEEVVTFKVNGQKVTADSDVTLLKNHLTYKWQKAGADGAYADLADGELVQNAGKYQLVVSLAKVAGICDAAADVTVKLEIEKSVVEIRDLENLADLRPGITVGEAKDANKDLKLRVDGTNRIATDYAKAAPVLTFVNAHDATKTPLADDYVLKADEDYVVAVGVELKDELKENYELGDTVFNFTLNNGYDTEVKVTYTDAYVGKKIGKTYGDGQPMDENTVKAAFTAAVEYTDDDGEKQTVVNPVFTYEWRDANKELMDQAPVEAGTYYYRVVFEDADGNYRSSYADVTVFIDMAKIIVAPVAFTEGVYVGDYVRDLLRNVKYEVYDAASGATRTDYFWGYAYGQDATTTQVYEPVFVIEEGEAAKDGTTKWSALDTWDQIRPGFSYRLKFSGNKAVYSTNGVAGRYEDEDWVATTIDINSAQTNYTVDTTNATLESYAKALTVNATSPVTISVDSILQNGAGATFENPITVVYTGKDIYNDPANKGAYKTAQAMANGSAVASNTDSSLTYTWQKLTYFDDYDISTVQDDQGNVKAPQKPTSTSTAAERILYNNWENSWNVVTFNDVESESSPKDVGVYRLKINYNDSTHKNASAENYVYYVIKQQDVAVKLTGTPSVYADSKTTVADFLKKLRTQNKLSEAEGTVANLIPAAVYPADVAALTTVDNTVYAAMTETEEAKLDLKFYDNKTMTSYTAVEWMDLYPDNYFIVERKIKEGEKAGTWKKVDNSEKFDKDLEYRLTVNHDALNARYENYNFGRQIGAHTQVLKEDYYKSTTLPITINTTEGKPVKIVVDESKITNRAKVYDGKPFDLTELKSAITVETVTDNGTAGTPVTTVAPKIEFYSVTDLAWLEETEVIHAGTYWIYVSTETDATYYGVARQKLETEFVITKRETKLIPVLADPIKAGKMGAVKKNIVPEGKFQVVGLAEGDEDAIKSITWEVYLAERNDGITYNYSFRSPVAEDAILYSDEVYYVKAKTVVPNSVAVEAYDDYGLPAYKENEYEENVTTGRRKLITLYYNRDYDWDEGIKEFTPVRAEAGIVDINTELTNEVTRSEAGEYTHVITPIAGIPALSGLVDRVETAKTGKTVELSRSHYFTFKIYAPEEYRSKYSFADEAPYIYKNAISASGAYVTYIDGDSANGITYPAGYRGTYINVAIDADNLNEAKSYSFDILWKTDYVEHFTVDMSKTSLLWDLTEAVAPKALKFNGASSKMTVGSTQQLDVKITKAQQADVIWLAYKTSDESVLKVEENGFVTALKAGTATVTVYPVKEDAEGNKVAIEGKGVKTATLKVKVTEVSAPKFSGLVAKDTYVNIKYKKPADGFRREVYVLEGKAKPADFEAKINEVVNGDFSAFAVAPEFVDSDKETDSMDDKGIVGSKTFFATAKGLKPNTQYTIYLRNVSGLRTMADGTTVAASAAGSVKSFKTIKAQEVGINITPAAPAVYDEDKDYYGDEGKSYDGNAQLAGSAFSEFYKVKLSDKSVGINTKAKFWEYHIQNYSDHDNVNGTDYIWRELPLDKTLVKTYMAPKMVYVLSDVRYSVGGYWYTDDNDDDHYYTDAWAKKRGYIRFGKYYYETASKIAAIDKKGKITLKGKGNVFVLAYDANTAQDPVLVNAKYGEVEDLYIYAAPNSMTAKPIKLYPGQTVYLNDFLEYKEGSTKLANYEALYADLSVAEASNEDFEITKVDNTYAITALKAGKSLSLNVTDAEVAKNGGSAVTVNVTSTELPAVKSLKKYVVFDTSAKYTFQYPAQSFQFREKLTDARGNVLVDTVSWLDADPDSYNAKTGMWTYTTSIGKMTLLSQYNLTVSAVYGENVSKEAKLKLKTINIPASSYYDLKPTDKNDGIDIDVTTQGGGYAHISSVVLKSGNDYTLKAYPDHSGYVDVRMTDTLTWKSSNTKVASVKAKTGTMTALLKTNKPGVTEISITSKLTKKVIARWKVAVSAVGEAGLDGQYFGTNEPYDLTRGELDDYGFDGNAISDVDALAVTLNTEMRKAISGATSQLFVFTAPALGQYSVSVSEDKGNLTWTRNKASDTANILTNTDSFTSGRLEKGEVVLIRVNNYGADEDTVTINVTGNMYPELEVGKEVKVRGGKTISFIAPEDNYYYAVYQGDNDKEATYHSHTIVNKDEYGTLYIGGSANKDYAVTIVKREPASVTADSVVPQYKYNPANIRWLSYTAAEDNTYTFTFTTGKDSDVMVRYYKNKPATATGYNSALQRELDPADSTYYKGNYTPVYDTDNTTVKALELTINNISLKAGETVYFALTNEDATEEKALVSGKVTAKEVPTANVITAGEDKQVTIGANGETEDWYKFTAAEDGLYTFYADKVETAAITIRYPYKNLARETYSDIGLHTRVLSVGNNVSENIQLKANQTVYLNFSVNSSVTKETPAKLVMNISKVTPVALSVDKDETITVTPTGTWYSVTVPATGLYTYEFKNGKVGDTVITAESFTTKQYGSLDSSYVGPISNGSTEMYSVGQTFYLYIKNSQATSNTAATATLTIKRRTAENKLTTGAAGNSVALKAEETWYSFTAEENNYYKFSYKNADSNVKNMTGMEYYDNLLEDTTNGMATDAEKYLKKGQTIYVKVKADDGTTGADDATTAKATITITKREVTGKLTLENKGVNAVTISKDQVAYYSFTAPEDNKYTFAVKDTSDDHILGSVRFGTDYVSESWDDTWYDGNSSEVSLKGGRTYYLQINTTAAKDATAQITITKREVAGYITTTAEPAPIALATNDVTYYSFTAMATGYYTFTATDVNKAMALRTGTDLTAITVPGYNNVSASADMKILAAKQMNAGDILYFAMKTSETVTDADPAKITISVSARTDAEVQKLAVGNSKETNEIKLDTKNQIKWYSFTSSEDNVYDFKLQNLSGGKMYISYNGGESKEYAADKSIRTNASLKTEVTIYIAAYATDVTTPVSGTVVIEKRTVESEQLTTAAAGKRVTLKKDGSDVWYKFQPTEKGIYTVYGLDGTTEADVRMYKSLGDTTSEASSINAKIFKLGKEVVYDGKEDVVRYFSFCASSTQTEDKFIDVYVVKRALTDTNSLNEKEVTLEQNKDQWYQITASQAGYYSLEYDLTREKVEDTFKDLSVVFYDEFDATEPKTVGSNGSTLSDDKKKITYKTGEFWLENGSSVYVKVYSDDATKETPVKATLRTAVNAPKTLNLGVNSPVLSGEKGKTSVTVTYAFTAPKEEQTQYRVTIKNEDTSKYVGYTFSYGNTLVAGGTNNNGTVYAEGSQSLYTPWYGYSNALWQNQSIVLKLSATLEENESLSTTITVEYYDTKVGDWRSL